ncbi:hypothetical protein [Arthrobacter citreus]|uniref:hypothetical protein n=1 Tax=Arthrobacter citreus TaxID=1670 RepID=UPI0036D9C05B
MNKERSDERAAKAIVENVIGIELEHADKGGGVDYCSADGRHALEVTRITDGLRRAGRQALSRSREADSVDGALQTCWFALVPDTQRRLKNFRKTVHRALVELELNDERSFDQKAAAAHVVHQGPMSPSYRPLLEAGVQKAFAIPNHAQRAHKHRVIPVAGSGGSSSGSDEAVALLVDALSTKNDNPKKLTSSGAEQRHLFVWIDGDTRFDIARPLSREAPAWGDDGFGVPSMPPALVPAITHLWVVHEQSRFGWLWDSVTWHELTDL